MVASRGRSAWEVALRALHERLIDVIEDIVPLIHEQAEMRLLVRHGALVQGLAAVVGALVGSGREAAIYWARVTRFVWLDDQTVLTFARARYALAGGGFAEGGVVWLDELRDRLLWRVQMFTNEAEARQSYEHHHRASVETGGSLPPDSE